MDENDARKLFGKSLEETEGSETAEAGALAFTEARLLAIPIRCLSSPFMHVTCPLILERFRRDLRAVGVEGFLRPDWKVSDLEKGQVHVADKNLESKALVLEDLVYQGGDVGHLPMVEELADALAGLLPEEEEETRERLKSGLAVVPDEDFNDLVDRAIPVRARTKLTGGKTADKWFNEDTGETEKGNLWYEESLPSDCLFASFVGERRHRKQNQGQASGASETRDSPLKIFRDHGKKAEVIQIGGNETTGCGLCFFSLWSAKGGTP